MITLKFKNSTTIDDFYSCTFISDLYSVEDYAEFSFVFTGEEIYQLGDAIEIFNNEDLILTGGIIAIDINMDGNIKVGVASSPWLLTKSYIPIDQGSSLGNNILLTTAIEKICGWVDIGVTFDADLIAAGIPVLPFTILERDVNLLENIKEIIDPYNLYMYSEPNGDLSIALRPVGIISDIQEIDQSNIIKSNMTLVEGNRASKYETIVQPTFRGLSTIPRPSDIEFNSNLDGISPLPITKRKWLNNSSIASNQSESNINRIACYNEGSTISINLELTQETFYYPGTVVNFSIPIYQLKDNNSFYITESVEFRMTQTETTAKYIFADINKYNDTYNPSDFIQSEWILY